MFIVCQSPDGKFFEDKEFVLYTSVPSAPVSAW